MKSGLGSLSNALMCCIPGPTKNKGSKEVPEYTTPDDATKEGPENVDDFEKTAVPEEEVTGYVSIEDEEIVQEVQDVEFEATPNALPEEASANEDEVKEDEEKVHAPLTDFAEATGEGEEIQIDNVKETSASPIEMEEEEPQVAPRVEDEKGLLLSPFHLKPQENRYIEITDESQDDHMNVELSIQSNAESKDQDLPIAPNVDVAEDITKTIEVDEDVETEVLPPPIDAETENQDKKIDMQHDAMDNDIEEISITEDNTVTENQDEKVVLQDNEVVNKMQEASTSEDARVTENQDEKIELQQDEVSNSTQTSEDHTVTENQNQGIELQDNKNNIEEVSISGDNAVTESQLAIKADTFNEDEQVQLTSESDNIVEEKSDDSLNLSAGMDSAAASKDEDEDAKDEDTSAAQLHNVSNDERTFEEDTIDETMEDIDEKTIERQLSDGPSYESKVDGKQKLLTSVVVSADGKSITGNLFEIDGIPTSDNNGPKRVRIHVRVLPSKKLLHKTKWVEVEQNKAVFNDEYKKSLDLKSNEKEKILRMRVYGDKKCIGNGFIKIDDNRLDKSGNKFWIPLIQNGDDQ